MNPSPSDSILDETNGATKAVSKDYSHQASNLAEWNNSAASMPPPLPERSLLDAGGNQENEKAIGEENGIKDSNGEGSTTKENSAQTAEEKEDESQMTGSKSSFTTTETGIVVPFSFVPDSSPVMESFVQQATRVQSLVLSAWQNKPARRRNNKRRRENENDAATAEPPVKRRLVLNDDSLLENMLREKTNALSTLQRQIESLETELSVLRSTNQNLRSEAEISLKRDKRNAEALRVAHQNAERARADTDAAETTAADLAQTLESLQAVVRETQDETRLLQGAHKEIQQKSTSLQTDLWEKEVRIACLEKEYNSLVLDYQKLQRAQTAWKQEKTQLEQIIEDKERTIGAHERRWQERRTMDEAREQRVKRLEEEWREAQSLLVEATSAQSASADTQSQLRSDLRTLQQKNEEQHERLVAMQEKSRNEHERHTKALEQAEQDGHQWRIQLETCQDQNERLRVEKSNLEKTMSKLKAQLAAKNSEMAPFPTNNSVSPDTDKSDAAGSFAALLANVKTPNRNAQTPGTSIRSGSCVICGKAGYGLMKRCQCGSGCKQTAHFSCIKINSHQKAVGPSGTPYRTPIILCGATTSPHEDP